MPPKDIPSTIGRYDVIDRIGHGGMGVVYRGRDPRIGRPVAIKLLRMSDEGMRMRFQQEAQSAGNLRHPNIVTIYDYGEHGEQPFIVMEFLEGVTLAEQIKQRVPLLLSRKLALIETLAAALDYAHNRGIVHRDIKPANIMVDGEGVLKILDFGIARVGDSGLTQAGQMIGTPNYMSPEQINGQTVDRRSDIFAVGLVAYELLSYEKAFRGDSLVMVMNAVLNLAPTPLGELCPDLSHEVQATVSKAIEKDLAQRYQTLAEFVADLTLFKSRVWPTRSAPDDQPTIIAAAHTPSVLEPTITPADQSQRAVEAALARARADLAGGDFESAIREASEILLRDPTNREALELTTIARGAAEKRHNEAAESAVREQRRLFDSGRRDEALAALERFSPPHESVNLALVEMRAEAARIEQEAAEQEGRRQAQRRWISRQLAFARAAIDEHQFAHAIELLEQVEQTDATADGVAGLFEEARAGLAAAEAEGRRRRDVAEKLSRADEALAVERLDEAQALVDSVLTLTPDHEGAIARRRAIEGRLEAQRQKEALDRRAASTCDEARRRFDAGETAVALAMLDAFTPAHPEVTRTRADLRSKLAAIEQAAREARIVEGRAEIDTEITRGRFAEALERLQRLEQQVGPMPELAAVADRARAGLQEENRRKDEERVRREAEAARVELARWARAQIDQARAQLGRQPQRVVKVLEDVRARLTGTEYDSALQRELEALSSEVGRRLKVQDLVAQARRSAQKAPENALKLLDEALALEPNTPEALDLRGRLQGAIAERVSPSETEAAARVGPAPPIEPDRVSADAVPPVSPGSSRWIAAGALAAGAIAIVGGYLIFRGRTDEKDVRLTTVTVVATSATTTAAEAATTSLPVETPTTAKQTQVAAIKTVLPTTISTGRQDLTTSIPVGRQNAATTSVLPVTSVSTSVPVRSIDVATVQDLLARYAAASRGLSVAAVQQIYPRLPDRTKTRIEALRKNFNYCDYRFTNVQVVSSSATEAVVRADSVESCKPKTGQRAIDAPGRQEFHFSKDPGGAWLVSEIFVSQ